ncbi:MAG: right-handed parallel beta-helix repeat-containing protein [Candidatus Hydrogenedentes bacterium]|nr:right-handed parallel beta-helix repeat-containing protein [Candidatus Hydrogenedentota bacterium]
MAGGAQAATVKFEPGPDAQTQVQEAFILSEPGTVFEFAAGTFVFNQSLSLDVDGCAVRGAGMDKTILTFKDQDAGAEGLYITADNITMEDFAVEDTSNNAIKSNAANNIVYRRLRAEWTSGPKSTNGPYGFYPVSSQNVLIEDCVVRGASDAGVYVGQSEHVILRRNLAEFNVAGIEIENCHWADVYENTATRNTGGILVFDLPGLPVQKGRDVRVFDNKVLNNDTVNFAPEGNIVGNVPTGTGVMVMANSYVEIFNNEIDGNQTANIIISSYLSTSQKKEISPDYYPWPEHIHIHNNTIGGGGNNPMGPGGLAMAMLAGKPLPDIVWDGMFNPEKAVDGVLPKELGLSIHDNVKKGGGDVSFVDLDGNVAFQDPAKATLRRDIKAHAEPFKALVPVVIKGVK